MTGERRKRRIRGVGPASSWDGRRNADEKGIQRRKVQASVTLAPDFGYRALLQMEDQG